MTRWYVRIRGRVLGPFSVPQLEDLRDRGQLRIFHEVSGDRLTWQSAAAALPELFAAPRPVVPPAGPELPVEPVPPALPPRRVVGPVVWVAGGVTALTLCLAA